MEGFTCHLAVLAGKSAWYRSFARGSNCPAFHLIHVFPHLPCLGQQHPSMQQRTVICRWKQGSVFFLLPQRRLELRGSPSGETEPPGLSRRPWGNPRVVICRYKPEGAYAEEALRTGKLRRSRALSPAKTEPGGLQRISPILSVVSFARLCKITLLGEVGPLFALVVQGKESTCPP